MGCLTTVTFYNDAEDEFRKDPKGFAEAIFRGMEEANRFNRAVDVPFKNYSGYLTVQHTRHADHQAVFVHSGNMVMAVGRYEDNFCQWAKRDPERAMAFLENAEWILKDAKKYLKSGG